MEVQESVLIQTAWPLVLRHDVSLFLVLREHHHQLAEQLLVIPNLQRIQLCLDFGVVGLLELLSVIV